MTPDPHSNAIRSEFGRTARVFSDRTLRRYDDLDVVGFSRVRPGASVLEVGVGTGIFLGLFSDVAATSIGVDLTDEMLVEARRRHPATLLVVADGRRLPLATRSIDLAMSAQTLHHVAEPVPFLMEMRRVVRDEGYVLLVDQVATEHFEEALMMTRLELERDPSHAASRSPSGYRMLSIAAGLTIVDERIVESRSSFESWMPASEFPEDRRARTLDFIERHADKTGMEFRDEDGELVFTRRRMMVLARKQT